MVALSRLVIKRTSHGPGGRFTLSPVEPRGTRATLEIPIDPAFSILVFDVAAPDAVFHALRGDRIGTIVTASPEASAAGGS